MGSDEKAHNHRDFNVNCRPSVTGELPFISPHGGNTG